LYESRAWKVRMSYSKYEEVFKLSAERRSGLLAIVRFPTNALIAQPQFCCSTLLTVGGIARNASRMFVKVPCIEGACMLSGNWNKPCGVNR
jgi:hypothetical protein